MRLLVLFSLLLLSISAPRRVFAAELLDFAFLPPAIVPQDICSLAPDDAEEAEEEDGAGDDLAKEERRLFLRYLKRDIRDLTEEDADRWFDFILALIAWREELDPSFAGTSAMIARIDLYIDADRLDALRASGLIPSIQAGEVALASSVKVALAQYYLGGIGVDQDISLAHALIRDAAYGGNPEALLIIARMNAAGTPMPDWDVPQDMTVSLAIGGLLGPLDSGICFRSERIAALYTSGDIVKQDRATAYAWYRFAADLGSSRAAWRVAEAQLTGVAPDPDPATLMHYLNLASARKYQPDAVAADLIRSSEKVPLDLKERLLGPGNATIAPPVDGMRPSLSHYLQMEINPDSIDVDESGPYLAYLRRLAAMPEAPGFVFTWLAQEVELREGHWKAEAEIMSLLEEAALRGDPEGMRMLAMMTMRYRDDPSRVSRAVSLLSESVSRFGDALATQKLEGLYRCQVPEAPMLPEARVWADAWHATGYGPLEISPEDLMVLDQLRDPEALATIQAHALRGEVQALSQMLERVQLDPLLGEDADQLWAARTQVSDKALELFAELEFSLATTPAERERAVALFRRVYLNNGVTTALDLAIALLEHDGRNPAIAAEIVTLLTQSGNRGEGASIRLLARLTADKRHAASLNIAPRTEAEVYDEFATAIEERGDFLALMFAIPHVSPAQAEDYIDRAVSLMVCGSKDVEEVADANAYLGDAAETWHWRQIAMTIEGGNSLSRLALTLRQMDLYATGSAPRPDDPAAAGAGATASPRQLFALYADPGRAGFDPEKAAAQLLDLFQAGDAADQDFALESWRTAPAAIRTVIEAGYDLRPLLRRKAEAGDTQAQHDLALALRRSARGAAELAESARWLQKAAELGHASAMVDLAEVLAQGLGLPQDRDAARRWYSKAGEAGDEEAAEMARVLALSP